MTKPVNQSASERNSYYAEVEILSINDGSLRIQLCLSEEGINRHEFEFTLDAEDLRPGEKLMATLKVKPNGSVMAFISPKPTKKSLTSEPS